MDMMRQEESEARLATRADQAMRGDGKSAEAKSMRVRRRGARCEARDVLRKPKPTSCERSRAALDVHLARQFMDPRPRPSLIRNFYSWEKHFLSVISVTLVLSGLSVPSGAVRASSPRVGLCAAKKKANISTAARSA